MSAEHFQLEPLVEHACELAGSDDFGDDDSWREGLALLCDGLVSEARLSDLGVEIAAIGPRAPDDQQAADHRSGARKIPTSPPSPIGRPIFIVGQPRTGTTILFDLLAQDPELRPPLTWEVDNPGPAAPSSRHTTPIRASPKPRRASRCPSR